MMRSVLPARATRPALGPYVTLPGGATLYCTDEGEGEPLLFVHGWTCDSTDYLSQIAHFRSWHRVIAPDLRGHGRSRVLADGYDPPTFARDLVELLDELGVERCTAIGHSLGGLIVSMLAVEHPGRMRALVCLDPAYGVTGSDAEACRAILELMNEPDWSLELARRFAEWEGPSTPPFFRELHVRRMLAMDPTVVTETFRRLFGGADPLACRERSQAYLERRACPVLGIYASGRDERVKWDAGFSRHRASRFLQLPLGHWPHHDAPDLINQLIEQWLATIP